MLLFQYFITQSFYSSGQNENYNFGVPNYNLNVNRFIEYDNEDEIIQIEQGNHGTVLVLKNGSLKSTCSPQTQISDISSQGFQQCFKDTIIYQTKQGFPAATYLLKNGSVVTCGQHIDNVLGRVSNDSCGVLTAYDFGEAKKSGYINHQLVVFGTDGFYTTRSNAPAGQFTRIKTDVSISNIIDVQFGNHAVYFTDKSTGKIYIYGYNYNGALCSDTENNDGNSYSKKFVEIDIQKFNVQGKQAKEIRKISIGMASGIYETDIGYFYCGKGYSPKNDQQYDPVLINLPESITSSQIVDFATTNNGWIFITSKQIFTIGEQQMGELGVSTNGPVKTWNSCLTTAPLQNFTTAVTTGSTPFIYSKNSYLKLKISINAYYSVSCTQTNNLEYVIRDGLVGTKEQVNIDVHQQHFPLLLNVDSVRSYYYQQYHYQELINENEFIENETILLKQNLIPEQPKTKIIVKHLNQPIEMNISIYSKLDGEEEQVVMINASNQEGLLYIPIPDYAFPIKIVTLDTNTYLQQIIVINQKSDINENDGIQIELQKNVFLIHFISNEQELTQLQYQITVNEQICTQSPCQISNKNDFFPLNITMPANQDYTAIQKIVNNYMSDSLQVTLIDQKFYSFNFINYQDNGIANLSVSIVDKSSPETILHGKQISSNDGMITHFLSQFFFNQFQLNIVDTSDVYKTTQFLIQLVGDSFKAQLQKKYIQMVFANNNNTVQQVVFTSNGINQECSSQICKIQNMEDFFPLQIQYDANKFYQSTQQTIFNYTEIVTIQLVKQNNFSLHFNDFNGLYLNGLKVQIMDKEKEITYYPEIQIGTDGVLSNYLSEFYYNNYILIITDTRNIYKTSTYVIERSQYELTIKLQKRIVQIMFSYKSASVKEIEFFINNVEYECESIVCEIENTELLFPITLYIPKDEYYEVNMIIQQYQDMISVAVNKRYLGLDDEQWTWIGVGCGLFVLLVITIVVLLMCWKKRKSSFNKKTIKPTMIQAQTADLIVDATADY